MTTPTLFSPITIGGLTFPNRIAVAPMCQYSADDGSATDWHMQHWMTMAISGAGMVTIEATAVERRGRISHDCLGLYSDHNEAAAARTLAAARRVARHGTRFGIQLAHAGRKASTKRPWEGGGPVGKHQDPWPTVAPSAVPHAPGWQTPTALDEGEIERVVAAFVQAGHRAVNAGFDFVELHFAHGYLAHSFLSPIANKRTDRWGGPLENRMRFALTVAGAVRAALPASILVGTRLSATDWVEGGFNPDEAAIVASALKDVGVGYICCSSGGVAHEAKIPLAPSYQVSFAEKVRREAGIPTRAVGLIDDPFVAEEIVRSGKADMVALGRGMLADPRWPWRAAVALGATLHPIDQYARCMPQVMKSAPRAPQSDAA